MSTVATLFTAVGYRIFDNPTLQSISTSSQPTSTEFIRWLNEGLEVLTQFLCERESSYGKNLSRFFTTRTARISSITQANPGVVTTDDDHNFSESDVVYLCGCGGMYQLNNQSYKATNITSDTLELYTNATPPVAVDTSSYDEYTAYGRVTVSPYYDDIATSLYNTADKGLVYYGNNRYDLEKQHERVCKSKYSQVDTGIPKHFHIDANGYVYLYPWPDKAEYLIEIPYWNKPTAITATTDTVPYSGIFDKILIEALVRIALNRNEYALDYELWWSGFLNAQASNLIRKRDGKTEDVDA